MSSDQGRASHRRLRGFWMPRPKIFTQSGCHTHFKLLTDFHHSPSPQHFFIKFARVRKLFFVKSGGGIFPNPPVAPPLTVLACLFLVETTNSMASNSTKHESTLAMDKTIFLLNENKIGMSLAMISQGINLIEGSRF